MLLSKTVYQTKWPVLPGFGNYIPPYFGHAKIHNYGLTVFVYSLLMKFNILLVMLLKPLWYYKSYYHLIEVADCLRSAQWVYLKSRRFATPRRIVVTHLAKAYNLVLSTMAANSWCHSAVAAKSSKTCYLTSTKHKLFNWKIFQPAPHLITMFAWRIRLLRPLPFSCSLAKRSFTQKNLLELSDRGFFQSIFPDTAA